MELNNISDTPAVLFMSAIAVPWVVWTTVSLFNQRQELALLKQLVQQIFDKLK